VDHNIWTFKDGAPANTTCLAQTNDGFLWMGGQNGLFRYDGTRFEPFRSRFGDRLLATEAQSLFGPPSGGLWVGYVLGGFSFLNNGRVTNYGSSTGTVYGFAQDGDGIVWAATPTGIWRFDHLGWQPIGVEWNVRAGPVWQVGFDSNGILWVLAGNIGAPMDLIYLLPGTRHFQTAERNLSVEGGFVLDADRAVITDPAARPMSDASEGPEKKPAAYPVLTKDSQQFLDRNNSLWISYDDKPIVMRVPKERLRGGLNKASPAGSESYDIFPFQMAQLVDREGNIWFGDAKGIHRLSYSPLNRQEFPKEGLGNEDFALAADDNGAVWISSHTSLVKGDLYYVSAGKAQLRFQQVTSSFAYRAPDRTFWFSGKGCLWHLNGHDFARVNLPPELANQFAFLQTITGDEKGRIWISLGRRGLYRWADGIWTSYGGRDDLPKTGIPVIGFTDSLGRVWFGYTKNQLAALDGDRVRVFGPSDGLQVGTIKAIHGRGSEIWIGGEFGLEQFDRGRFHNIAALNDEWLHGISGIVETANGDLWLNANSGIFHVRKAEISSALRDSNHRVKGEHFGRFEGLPGIATQFRPLPTAIEGSDGRLWFTLQNGVVWIDPAAYSEKKAASPPIAFQSFAADDKSYALDPRLSFPAHTSSVQVSYSAVSLSDPEAIRFRYKVQETDKDWNEAAAATPVTYRNLPPGSYHFSVEASDTNGDWSGAPAKLAFTIQPAYYQTNWFRALCGAAVLVLLWAFYQFRLRQLHQEFAIGLEARVNERTRIARELHDTLLQNFHGLMFQFQAASNLMLRRPDEAKKSLDDAIVETKNAITESRNAIQGLRSEPIAKGNLAELLASTSRELADATGREHQPVFDLIEEGERRTLSPTVSNDICRTALELMRNAYQHAHARRIEAEIRYGDSMFRLRIRDDGQGIEPKVLKEGGRLGHWGLRGVRERADRIGARLEVWSEPGNGTEVQLLVPAAIAYESFHDSYRAKLVQKVKSRAKRS
jgi:signal transduction histidine kinase/ligand-binding sensor domain-containing protein